MAEYENFVFYGSMRQTVEALPEEMGNKLLRTIMEYGTTGILENDDTVIYAIMLSIIPNIKSAKKRYSASVENGKKGGRPTTVDEPKILELHNQGLTQKQISESLSISIKSVQRVLGQNRQKLDKDIDTDKDNDKDTYTDKEEEAYTDLMPF